MTVKSVILSSALAVVTLTACAQPEVEKDTALINVTGTAELRATPDIALISASLVQQGEDSAKLLDDVNSVMTRVIERLKSAGVSEADIQAGQVNINQVWQRHDGRNQPSGYNARRPITVRVDKLSEYPKLIGLMSSAGINTINSINFDFSARKKLKDSAMTMAAKDAERKAGVLAEALDLKDCLPSRISEEGQHFPMPRLEMAAMKAQDSGFNPGEQTLSASVGAVFTCRHR